MTSLFAASALVFSVVDVDCKKLHLLCEIWLWAENSCNPNNDLTQLSHINWAQQTTASSEAFFLISFWQSRVDIAILWPNPRMKALTESLLAVEILISARDRSAALYAAAIRLPLLGRIVAWNCYTRVGIFNFYFFVNFNLNFELGWFDICWKV